METNEVQWHPPEQLSVAADTQSVDDSTAVAIPSYDGYQEEQSDQEEEEYDIPKGEYRHDNYFTLLHQKGGCLPLSSKRNQKGHQNRKEQEGEKVEV